MALFGTSVSLAAAADDLQRLSWTLRRKPLESFLAPQAAVPLEGGGGALVCRDGSLVSLLRVSGARSMTGAEDLKRFVALASRKLNTAFSAPGHALHVAFERALDEAHALAARHGQAVGRQAVRLGLDLEDLMAERARRLAPLMAAETLAMACWTRPSVLPKDRLDRERKALRRRLRDWLPAAGEAQCPHLAPEALWPRHEALLDTVEAVLAEAGIVAARLPEEDALRAIRRMTNGAASTAPDWRPVTAANDAPPRLTEPPEAGAFPLQLQERCRPALVLRFRSAAAGRSAESPLHPPGHAAVGEASQGNGARTGEHAGISHRLRQDAGQAGALRGRAGPVRRGVVPGRRRADEMEQRQVFSLTPIIVRRWPE